MTMVPLFRLGIFLTFIDFQSRDVLPVRQTENPYFLHEYLYHRQTIVQTGKQKSQQVKNCLLLCLELVGWGTTLQVST